MDYSREVAGVQAALYATRHESWNLQRRDELLAAITEFVDSFRRDRHHVETALTALRQVLRSVPNDLPLGEEDLVRYAIVQYYR